MCREKDLPAHFQSFITEQDLIHKEDSLLLAYSGGADSTLLLHLLLHLRDKWKLALHALHFHHGLRRESDSELEFCRERCREWAVEFHSEYLDVHQYAQAHKLAIEEAARILRYNALQVKALELGCNSVVTAHHADDVTETFLMHLFQGSGVSGLASLKARRGNIIRPLLFCTKQEILTMLHEEHISYVQDGSNKDNSFNRNYLRNEILPLIHKRYPAFSEKIRNLNSIITLEDEDWNARIEQLEAEITRTKDRIHIPVKLLRQNSPALMSRCIYRLIRQLMGSSYYPSFRDIRKIIFPDPKHRGNTCILDKKGLLIHHSYDEVVLEKKNENFPLSEIYVKIIQSGSLRLPQGVLYWNSGQGLADSGTGCSLALPEAIKIRSWQKGDSFYFNRENTQKLQDYFINNKIKAWQRREAIMILNPEDRVMAFYIPQRGWRVSCRFYIQGSEPALYLEMQEG